MDILLRDVDPADGLPILPLRASRFEMRLRAEPGHSSIVSYGTDSRERTFITRTTKTGISVREVNRRKVHE